MKKKMNRIAVTAYARYREGIKFICAHATSGKDPLVVVGEGDLTFYLVAIVQQIKAVRKDKDIDADKLFTMLREMYDAVNEVDP